MKLQTVFVGREQRSSIGKLSDTNEIAVNRLQLKAVVTSMTMFGLKVVVSVPSSQLDDRTLMLKTGT
jgi:hypothetical protein